MLLGLVVDFLGRRSPVLPTLYWLLHQWLAQESFFVLSACPYSAWIALNSHFLACRHSRDTKSQNFPVGIISRAKTFRAGRVNHVRDKNAPKARKTSFAT